MREFFQRDDEIDSAMQKVLANTIENEPQVYTDDELDVLDFITDTLSALKEGEFEKLDSPDHFVDMSLTVGEGDRTMVFRATTVRPPPPPARAKRPPK
jgi:hypothetical protein